MIYGAVKGWFTSKKADTSATGNGFVFPNISTGSLSSSNNGNYSGGGLLIVQ